MKFHDIVTPKASRVLGIDPSTKTVAWCMLDGSEIAAVGEETLGEGSLYERMKNAYDVAERLADMAPEFVAIESAVYVNNTKVVIKLAYFYGIVMGMLAHRGIMFDDVPPITWETWIGNPPTRKPEKSKFKKENPDFSNYKIKKHFREARKQRTMDWVKENYDYETDNDNIADAIAIAAYAQGVMTS